MTDNGQEQAVVVPVDCRLVSCCGAVVGFGKVKRDRARKEVPGDGQKDGAAVVHFQSLGLYVSRLQFSRFTQYTRGFLEDRSG